LAVTSFLKFQTINTLSVSRLADYFKIGPVFNYFLRVFRKPDPNHPSNVNLRMMHGINRISIVMFLFCILVMLYRAFLR